MRHFHSAIKIAGDSFLSLLLWLFIAPVAMLVPKKSRSVVVMGRQRGMFVDNAKYFFRFGAESDKYAANVVFLTTDRELCTGIIELGSKAVIYPSFKGAVTLIRAQVVVYDSVEWIRNGRLQLSIRARKVQLWHGAPLKQIELPLYQRQLGRMKPVTRSITVFYNWITARYIGCDLLISTSSYFSEHAFSKAFKTKDILESGYPRNDILCGSERTDSVRGKLLKLNTDDRVISRIKESRRVGKQIILYMPTFRKDWQNQFDSGVLDIDRMASFAENNGILLVFKFHPLMASYYNLDELDSIVQYDPAADVYPILPHCDCLITDYSSIYFDYLFVDKPIIFFSYDC